MKDARLLNLRHPRVRLKSYPTRTNLLLYDLNLTLGCHRCYYIVPLPVLDPIYVFFCLVIVILIHECLPLSRIYIFIFINSIQFCNSFESVFVLFPDVLPGPVQPNGDIYIQGTRLNGTSTWSFDDGQEMRFFHWNAEKNQPQMRVGETVIAIQKVWAKMWHDTMESSLIMFVCEIPL